MSNWITSGQNQENSSQSEGETQQEEGPVFDLTQTTPQTSPLVSDQIVADVEGGEVESTEEGQEGGQEGSEGESEGSSGRERAGLLNELRTVRTEFRDYRRAQQNREAILEERLGQLTAAMSGNLADTSQEGEEPDANDDPVGHLLWQQQRSSRETKDALESMQQQIGGISAQTQAANMASNARKLEDDFILSADIERADYDHALDFLRNITSSILNLQGYNEAQIPQIIGAIEYNMIRNLSGAGDNPAKAIYDLVTKSVYAPRETKTVSGQREEETVNNSGLAQMREGKKAAVSLSKTRGAPGKRRITLNDLAAMSPADFSRLLSHPGAWETINTQGHVDVTL